jgi:hypothetical protein
VNFRSAGPVAWLIAAALFCSSPAAFAKDKWDDSAKGKSGKQPAAKKADKDDEMPAEKKDAKATEKADAKDVKDDAASKGKIYRFKAQKKGAVAGTQMMTLTVEDPFLNKTENLAVPNNDPASKQYDPLTAVADVVTELKPGDIIEVETEKQKGRTIVTSVSKAEVEPGEELPNGYVFVEQDESEVNGMPSNTVTLKKFGRELKVVVPYKKDDEYKDAKWEPDQKIDYVVRRLQAGTVVEAQFTRRGKGVPMITEIYEYRPPERGKFVGLKKVEFNSWPAAGFELKAADDTTITFTLDGSEVTKNGETLYAPNPQHLAAVKRLKPDTEIEVRYRVDGRTWIMRDVKVLAPPPVAKKSSKTTGKTAGDDKKDDGGKMEEDQEKTKDKPAVVGGGNKDKAGPGKGN